MRETLVSIIIPTYNERENVKTLIPRIFEIFARSGIKGEVVIVDDNSPDGTSKVAKAMGKKYEITLVRRKQKTGLASAVLDGLKRARGRIIGIMDADLSHPPDAIPDLLKPILSKEADITIGSRYIRGGRIKGWPLKRKVISKVACLLAKPLINVKDPVSGFFFFRKEIVEGKQLKPSGYKIGLEIFVKCGGKIKEIPYEFVDRKKGRSKLGLKENIAYIKHIARLYWYRVSG